MLPAAAAAAVISQMDLGGNWYNELKNWALNLWDNVNQRGNTDPVGQTPDSTTGKPEYSCVALQNEVTNVKEKMSSQRVRPPSYMRATGRAPVSNLILTVLHFFGHALLVGLVHWVLEHQTGEVCLQPVKSRIT